jgi:phage terminase small subunit
MAKLQVSEPPQSTDLVSEHTEFQSHLPYMGISRGELTMQQEKLVSLISSGMTVAAAGRGAGYASPNTAYQASKVPAVQQAIAYFRQEMREEVKYTNKHAHMMYMEAYNSSANATEMKNTTDSLVKLHGLAAPENQPQVNININGTKQLERMTDEDLLKIAGKDIDYLEPRRDAE